jgi:hypothetical protein
MDSSKYVRDASKIHAALKELPDGSVICTKDIKLVIPERYKQKRLMVQGLETYVLAIFALVVDDKYYGVSMADAMMRVGPANITTVKYGDDSYLEFQYEKGDVVIGSTELIRDSPLVYSIFDEFVSKARVPWFMNYEDLAKIFDTAEYHAGASLGGSRSVIELIISMIARDPKDLMNYYRHVFKDPKDMFIHPPSVVPLRSVALGATNTTAKIIGAYADEGFTSALDNPSERVEPIEEILRQ